MDTWSTPEVAAALNTTGPRVRRCAERCGIAQLMPGRWDEAGVDALRRRLGSVPPGLSIAREDAFVLAALNVAPMGLRSARSAARAASVSPTTAAAALRRLQRSGLVRVETVRSVEDKVVDIEVYVVNRGSRVWRGLAPIIRQVVLPDPVKPPSPRGIPRRLWRHFWNTDPARVKPLDHADFVAARLLQSNDPEALAWAATRLPASSIRRVRELRGVDRRTRALASLVAGEVGT